MRKLIAILGVTLASSTFAGTLVDQGMGSTGNKAWRMQGSAPSGSNVIQAGNPIATCGYDGINCIMIATDSNGNQKVVGPDAVSAFPSSNPVTVGGVNASTGIQFLAVDSVGHAEVVGPDTVGAAPSYSPISVAGVDQGGNVTRLLTNLAGAPVVVGPDSAGAAATMNPNQVAGLDAGGLVRALLLDTAGRVLPAGTDAIGAAPTINPLLIAGVDATSGNVDIPQMTGGALHVTGTVGNDTAIGTNNVPAIVGYVPSTTMGYTGGNIAMITLDEHGQVRTNPAADVSGATSECLVSNVGGTSCPSVALSNRKGVELYNNGPNKIFCTVDGSTPVVNKARPIAAGASWGISASSNIGVSCIADVAAQVTGAATIVTELR